MSINPVSDIVLDVARAADPVKAQAAAERLISAASADQSLPGGFDTALNYAGAKRVVSSKALQSGGANPAVVLRRIDARTKAYKGLEQLVLKNLLESMLPRESNALFGADTAGDIWRSMLADQLATQIGKSVNLGIAPVHGEAEAIRPGENSIKRQL